ncbi:MAG TPA: DUF899 domain-containing protein [Streptosporangiaceae bacterium]|jgi:predicted dithiol-disulfide oxidoreductase (DUF899 family)|nr:DUF899 domain-containing protein [Streptosporangiaceae bacterium]
MSLPDVVSREEWLAARQQLLAEEKEMTRQRDRLNAARRRLPMVRIDKKYKFEGPEGTVDLLDLFGGGSQLIVQHVMYDPEWDAACPSCTASMDESTPALLEHLSARGTAYVRISRAPYDKIVAYRDAHGWSFPWYSSHGSDFNYDFNVTLDPAVAPTEYNYRTQQEWARIDPDWLDLQSTEVPGVSCFLREGDEVYHTYSTYARGTELVGGLSYPLLDLTALGRQEEWEEPKGRAVDSRDADPSFR